MQRLIPTGLRAQISAVVVAPAIVIAVLASLASLWTLSRISSERSTEALHRATERTEMSMQASEQGMQTLALALATNPAWSAAAAARDTAGLGAMMMPAYESLQESDPRIAVLEVGGADGRVLFRANQPDRAGDDKSNSLDIRMALAGQVATGAAASVTTGDITYGATVPLQQNGRVVGTLRVAGGIDGSMASVVAAITGGEAIVIGRGQPLGATLHGVAPELLGLLQRPDSPARAPDGMMMNVPGAGSHLMRTLPINDLAGQPVGAIIFGLPMRDWQAAERWGALTTLGAALIGLVLAIPLALILAGRLASLIRRIAGAMSALAGGDLSQPIPGVERRDEVGAMAGALEVFRDKLAESRRLEDASLVARLAREKRAAALEGYTQDFGQSIAGVMSQLEQASKGMKQAATRMTSVVGQTCTQASGTAGEATEASGNLTAVAAAVEQMSASVGEISRQVAHAAKVAAEAVREAVAADGRMRAVTGSADRIGDILGVISDVAARTNLLALNATIEAARAGEAGKGFAVVASEVKQLAAQTARATEDVATQIAAMRMAADEAASAMGGISRTIARIDEVATTIAAAVEEQGASTREITQRLQGVAGSTGGVTQAMGAVLRLAEEAGEVSTGVEAAAAGIGDQAATLRAEVESFLHNLRDNAKDRRSYERRRVQGGNATVVLAGRELVLPLADISAAGVGLRFSGQAHSGSSVTIILPGTAALGARIVRCEGGVMGILFNRGQEAAVDEAMMRLCAVPA